ncbi:hypothetical protein [Streptomyces californicus]|uniref:hypothetical protein n=1 Tax=Streptomyces californicus TaxID=67351 RepID=UPI0037A3D156
MPRNSRIIDTLKSRFSRIHVEISPPRTASTALSRALWGSPEIGFHSHEPFESRYWGSASFEESEKALLNPLRIADETRPEWNSEMPQERESLLIKDMTFQVDEECFELLAELTTEPILFSFRDPRLALHSRLRKVRELGRGNTFPPFESGWYSFRDQMAACEKQGLDYAIVDTSDLRAQPVPVLREIYHRLGLTFSDDVTSWKPRSHLHLCEPEVGALMSDARRESDPFFRRVLGSSGIQPVDQVDLDALEEELADVGLAAHLAECMDIYAQSLGNPHRVMAPTSESGI